MMLDGGRDRGEGQRRRARRPLPASQLGVPSRELPFGKVPVLSSCLRITPCARDRLGIRHVGSKRWFKQHQVAAVAPALGAQQSRAR